MEIAKKTVLVVDSDKDFIAAVCGESGKELPDITWIIAYDGEEAIMEFEKHHPAVIITEMMLPKKSGFLVLEKIRRFKEKNNSKLPVVIMATANSGQRDKDYATALGVWRYMFKPVCMKELLTYVRLALLKAQAPA